MDLNFVYDEMESGMEVDSDPPDPLGIPSVVAARNWTYSGAEKFNLISIYYTKMKKMMS